MSEDTPIAESRDVVEQELPNLTATPKSKVPSHYWQQAGSVLLGAVIGVMSTVFVTYLQMKSQNKQFIIEKKLTALKEYSTTYNQQAGEVLSRADSLLVQLETIEQVGVDQISDEEFTKLGDLMTSLLKDTHTYYSNLISQKTIIFALFGIEPTTKDFASFSNSELQSLKVDLVSELTRAKSKKQQMSALGKLFKNLKELLGQGREGLVSSINEDNEDIRKLAQVLYHENH